MLRVIVQVIWRDLLLAARQKADVLNTLFFFVVVVTIVPLGIGPELNLLRAIAPGVVWVAALLAAILSLPRLFANAPRLHDHTLARCGRASRCRQMETLRSLSGLREWRILLTALRTAADAIPWHRASTRSNDALGDELD